MELDRERSADIDRKLAVKLDGFADSRKHRHRIRVVARACTQSAITDGRRHP